MKTSQVEESWHPKMQFSNFHPPPVSLSLVGSGKLEFVATPQLGSLVLHPILRISIR